MNFDFDPEKPEDTPRKVAGHLDLLQTLLRDCPKQEGFELTPAAAAALVETFTAMAKAMQQAEGLSFDFQLRLKKTAA
jgi:hypothetical protein